MPQFRRSTMSIFFSLAAMLMIVSGFAITGVVRTSLAHAAPAAAAHASINCATGALVCMEVANSEKTFAKYVGHDEPSDLFYSNVPGSGNQMRYTLTLPRDPSPSAPLTPGKSFNFELHPAFWFVI